LRSFYLTIAAFALACPAPASAADPQDQPAGPVVLKLVSKTDTYFFDGRGKTPKEYKEYLEELAKKQKNGEHFNTPKSLPVDLVLLLENTSREKVTVYVNGYRNTHTFHLTGGSGVVNLMVDTDHPVERPGALRASSPVTIEPGKTYEMPMGSLAGGKRNEQLSYWTGPGEYKLSAEFTLVDAKGNLLPTLESEPIRINVVEK
jgi:hypothetical protein